MICLYFYIQSFSLYFWNYHTQDIISGYFFLVFFFNWESSLFLTAFLLLKIELFFIKKFDTKKKEDICFMHDKFYFILIPLLLHKIWSNLFLPIFSSADIYIFLENQRFVINAMVYWCDVNIFLLFYITLLALIIVEQQE